ncbi:MAG: hypothetical protein FWE46_06795 [Coriobacteriia bacterium]|nr:hypothetical protein [Coriobacteriia bacterium]MCL2537639.1 hypothetical protein [Coriobacteriia bacterium]
MTYTNQPEILATKHQPFLGLQRPFLIWLLTSAPLFLFGNQITHFIENVLINSDLLGNYADMAASVYGVVAGIYIGGMFYGLLLGYLIDAIFYISRMPQYLVLKTDDSIILAKPMEIMAKGNLKRLSRLEGTREGQWLGATQLDPDDVWDDNDLTDQVEIPFADIKSVWFNIYEKDVGKTLAKSKAEDRPVAGALIIQTAEGVHYCQPILKDLRPLAKALATF